MKKLYSSEIVLGLLFSIIVLCSCKKNKIPTPQTPIVNPTGSILTFTVPDTVLAFNKAAMVEWKVIDVNDKTVVKLNDSNVGPIDSKNIGPLRSSTTFTLALNNGLKQTKEVKVADTLTTALWNNNKGLKMVKSEVWSSINGKWEQYTFDKNERTKFFLNGTSNSIDITLPLQSPTNRGQFTVIGPKTFKWHGIDYTIISITTEILMVEFLSGSGESKARDTYSYVE